MNGLDAHTISFSYSYNPVVAMRRSGSRPASWLVWSLTALTAVLSCSLLFGNRGFHNLLVLRGSLSELSAQAYARIRRNQELRERLDGLRYDDRVLEEVARSTLGVVHDDEMVYVFRPRGENSRR